MSKTNKILSVLLAVQLLLTGYLYWSGHRPAKAGVQLLTGVTGGQVQQFTISESDGKQVILHRQDKGWSVQLAPGREYPADGEKVDSMLNRLVALKSSRLVSRTKGGQRRLKVADDLYNRKLELVTDKGDRVLYLGTSPSYQSVHVRAGDSKDVYLVRDLAAWELPDDPSGWWQARYLDIDPAQALEVEVNNKQGTLHLKRDSVKDPWRLDGAGPKPDAKKVANLLPTLCRVTINKVVADAGWQPKGQPEATLKLKSAKGQEELKIWPRPDEKSDYPLKADDSAFYAKASSYAVEPILNAKAAELQAEAGKPGAAKPVTTKSEESPKKN